MKLKSLIHRLTSLALMTLPSFAHAGAHLWSGAVDGSWSNPANWSSGGAPSPVEAAPVVLQFPSTVSARREMVHDIDNLKVDVLAFYGGGYELSSAASAITITGNQPPFPYAGNLVSGGSATNRFDTSVDLILAKDITIQVANGATLECDAYMSGAGGFTKTGAGTLGLSGLLDNTYAGKVTVLDGTLFAAGSDYGGFGSWSNPKVSIPGDLIIGDTNMTHSPRVRLDYFSQLGNTALSINPNGTMELSLYGGCAVTSLTMTGGKIEFVPHPYFNQYTNGWATNYATLVCGTNFTSYPTPLSTATISGRAEFHFITSNGFPSFINVTGGKLIMDADITGDTTLHKIGSGELIWNGSDEFDGDFLIDAGLLSVTDAKPFKNITNSVTVANGAQLAVLSAGNISTPIHLNGFGPNRTAALLIEHDGATFPGAITVDSDSAIRVSDAADTASAIFLKGSKNLYKRGPGALQLNGDIASQMTGTLVVEEGTLQFKKLSGVAAVVGPLIVGQEGGGVPAEVKALAANQLPTSIPITVNDSGTLNLNGFNQTVGPITLQGGDITTFGGTLTLAADLVATNGLGSLISGAIHLGNTKRAIHISPGYGVNIQATMSDIAYEKGFDLDGGGTLTLSGANSFLYGPINVKAGVLYARNDLALGSTSGGTMVSTGARLAIDGRNLGAEPITLNGDGGDGYGALSCAKTNTLTGPITLASDATLNVVSVNNQLILSGAVSGPGGITKIGAGTLVLTGNPANTYGGATTVSEGALELSKSGNTSVPAGLVIGDDASPLASHIVRILGGGQLSSNAPVVINSSGILDLSGAFFASQTMGSLRGNGPLKLGVSPVTVGRDNTDGQFNGVITGTGTVTKQGSGAWILGGTSDQFAGATIVEGGSLRANWIPLSPITVSTGKLTGNGVVGNVTGGGGVVNPGPGVADWKLKSKNLLLNAGSTFVAQLNSTNPIGVVAYSQAKVTGTVSLGDASLTATLGFNSAVSNRFVIIDNDANDPVVGTFKNLPEGGKLVAGGAQFQITYLGGDGNDVVLTQIGLASGAHMGGVKKLPGGGIQIDGTGFPNANYTVQAATNLTPPILWTDIGSITGNQQSQLQFIDNNATNFPVRFYRFTLP